MKYRMLQVVSIIGSCLIAGCNFNSGDNTGGGNPEQMLVDSTTNGEKTSLYENGKPHYIVEYKNGKANGRVREYTTDGKLYMDALFQDGHRNGTCTHFYKNGKPFEVSEYVNGEKEGIESKYYDNGKLLATRVYKKNQIQPGLREYDKSGTEIDNDNKIIITEIDHTALEGKFIIKVSLSNPQKNVTYYAAPLSDPAEREKLKQAGDAGLLEIPVSSRNFTMKSLLFQAEYRTRLGNTMVLHKSYNLAVD